MNKDLTIRKLFAATVSLQKTVNSMHCSTGIDFLAGLLIVHSILECLEILSVASFVGKTGNSRQTRAILHTVRYLVQLL